MATTATLQVHPAAEVFPLLPEPELTELVKDIAHHGLKEKITLWRGGSEPTAPLYLLDGRNRLEALRRSGRLDLDGLEPMDEYAVVLGPGEVRDPAAFVISKNIRRRHLTKEQRAALILKVVEATITERAKVARSVRRDERGRVQGSAKDPVLAAAVEEGRKHDISKRTIQRVRAKATTATTPEREITVVAPQIVNGPTRVLKVVAASEPPVQEDVRTELRRLLEEGRRRMKTLSKAPAGHLHTEFIAWMRAELDRIAGAR
jgi:hypothetical protein